MKQYLLDVYRSLIAARQRRADVLVLEYLDARALRDIGLEGGEQARLAQARARQDALAWRGVLSPGFGGFQ